MQISDLYQTKISCSTYNANIDSTDTVVTVKLIDFNGAAVTNKSVTLTCDKGYFNKNGSTSISGTTTKSITATTNSSGEITATWTASEWGLCTFSTNNSNIQIKVGGWKTARNTTDVVVRYNEKYVNVILHTTSAVSCTTSTGELGAEVLKDGSVDLRPSMPCTIVTTNNVNVMCRDNSYKIGFKTISGTTSTNLYASFLYARK